MQDEGQVLKLYLDASSAEKTLTTNRADVLEAMMRKARKGHVIGILPYGYRPKEVTANGTRDYVTREIVSGEAEVVRRIFEETFRGLGKRTIINGLERDGIKPRRGKHWTPSTLSNILENEIYRGEIVSHRYLYKSKYAKRTKGTLRPPSEWIRVQSPADRIVSDKLWYGVEKIRLRNAKVRAAILTAGKRFGGPPRDRESEYLLTGFAKCGVCQGPICAIRRDVTPEGLLAETNAPGSTRVAFYACLSYRQKGLKGCTNGTSVRAEVLEAAVREAMQQQLNQPRLLAKVIANIQRQRSANATAKLATKVRADIAAAERAYKRADEAMDISDKPLAGLVAKMQRLETELAGLRRQLAAMTAQDEPAAVLVKGASVKMQLWLKGLLKGDTAITRLIFREFLTGKIVLTPAVAACSTWGKRARVPGSARKDTRAFRFEGQFSVLPLFSGLSTSDPSDTPSVAMWQVVFQGIAA